MTDDKYSRLSVITAREIVHLASKGSWFPDKKEIVEAVARDPEARQIFERLDWTLSKVSTKHFDPVWSAVYAQLEVCQRDPLATTRQKAADLRVKLDLEEIVVAPSVEELGERAARLFMERVSDGDSVAVSCGSTLERMAVELARLKSNYMNLTVYSGVATCSDSTKGTLPSTVANLFTHCGNVETLSFHFPGRIHEKVNVPGQIPRHTISGLLNERLFQRAHDADFVFLGIGVLGENDRGAFSTHVREIDSLPGMRAHGVAGEVFHWPFTRDGDFLYDKLGLKSKEPTSAQAWRTVDPKLTGFFEHTYTMRWNALGRDVRNTRARERGKQRTTTIAVAGGAAKHEAIWIALSKLPRPVVDILVTDPVTIDHLASQAGS